MSRALAGANEPSRGAACAAALPPANGYRARIGSRLASTAGGRIARRRPFLGRWLLCAVAAAPLALAGCGEDKAKPDAYANDVCNAVVGWTNAVKRRAANAEQTGRRAVRPGATPAEGIQQALAAYFDGLIKDTYGFVRRVEAAGVPDAEGGEKTADQIRSTARRMRSALQDTRRQVDRIPTDSTARANAQAGRLAESVEVSLGRVAQTLNRPASPELETAFERAGACARARS